MTNEEYIKTMNKDRLGQFLCDVSNCNTCEIREMCGKKYPRGYYDWLEDTYNGIDIVEDFYTVKHSINPTNHRVEDVVKTNIKEEINVDKLSKRFKDIAERGELLTGGGVTQRDLLMQIIEVIVVEAMAE